MALKLKFTAEAGKAPVKENEQVNPMVSPVKIRPDLEARYNTGLAQGFSKSCAECTGWMKRTCKTPKKKEEVATGQKPCREFDLDGRLVGVSEAEIQAGQPVEKTPEQKERSEVRQQAKEARGEKPKWQVWLDKRFKKGLQPLPQYMNQKRWEYWRTLTGGKEPTQVTPIASKTTVKVKAKVRRA